MGLCCYDDDSPIVPANLKITVNYTGVSPAFGAVHTSPGTGKIYVYLYKSFGLKSNNPVPSYSADSSTNNAVLDPGSIAPGTYYVAVCYDYRYTKKEKTTLEISNPYGIYDGDSNATGYTVDAIPITLQERESKEISITFDSTYIMTTDSTFMPKP